MEYRRDIDGLRAVAVVPVVLFHAGVTGVPGGFVGVDVFFVISGYLITAIVAREIDEGRFSLLSFYERRARRILPALAAMLIASLSVGWFMLMPLELEHLGRSVLAASLFASNFHFASSFDYFARDAEYQPLLHTWSLAVEEQFYLIFPPLLMALVALGCRRRLLPIVAALSIVSLAAAVLLLDRAPENVFYLIPFRAWELGAGAMLALTAWVPPRSRTLREVVALAGFIAIAVPMLRYGRHMPFPGIAAVPPVLGAGVLIWLGRPGGGSLVHRALMLPPVVGIGIISYSLYLWHWPIFSFLRILEGTVMLGPIMAAAALTSSVVAAWLSWRFIERPFRIAPPEGFRRRTIFALAAVVIIVPGWAGETLHDTGGMPQRLSPQTARIAQGVNGGNPDRLECLKRMPAQGLCSIGAPLASAAAGPTFLLWGDSHAEMLRAPLAAGARAAGLNGLFAGRAGCAPLLEVQRLPRLAECQPFNAAVWSWLRDHPEVETVILGARWTLDVEGHRFGTERGGIISWRWIGDSSRRPSSDSNPALVEAGIAAMVDRLVADGRRVVLLGPVPEPGYDVPLDTARRLLMGRALRPAMRQSDLDARASRTEALLRRVAARSPAVIYVPLADAFCNRGTCPARMSDNTPIFTDDDHLASTAADRLLRRRLQTIWAAVPAPTP